MTATVAMTWNRENSLMLFSMLEWMCISSVKSVNTLGRRVKRWWKGMCTYLSGIHILAE